MRDRNGHKTWADVADSLIGAVFWVIIVVVIAKCSTGTL